MLYMEKVFKPRLNSLIRGIENDASRNQMRAE
jgi:hypothetical protein